MPTTSRATAFAIVLVLSFAATPVAAQEPATTAAPPPASGRKVTSPGQAEWATDAAQALSRAAAQKKLVFYEFTNPGCGDCRRMQSLLYPAFDFEALLVGMIPAKIELDSPQGKEIGERYAITEVPAILITTPEGRLVFLMQGFKNAPDFYRHVHTDLDAYRGFARRVDSQDVGTLSANEAYVTGTELYARKDFQGAASRLRRAAAAPDAAPALREKALEGLSAAELELGLPAEARRSIEKVIATTKSPAQKERAELFLAQIALTQNKTAEALALYKKFERDHPDSKYLDKVHSFVERLEAPAPAK